MIALIDADSILYKYASIYQDVFSWDDEDIQITTDIVGAKMAMKDFIDSIKSATKCDEYELVLSPMRNFRYDIEDTYKANRKAPKYNLLLKEELREYMVSSFNTYECSNIEADDYVVLKATENPSNYIMCHIDKDLNQASGKHYNYNSQEKYKVTEEDGDFFFYQQVLEGDSVDNIKGCPNIGRVKALRLLTSTTPDKYWEVIVEAYEKAGQTEEDAIRNARLVRMLRHGEYNFETKEIKLWSPDVKYEQ